MNISHGIHKIRFESRSLTSGLVLAAAIEIVIELTRMADKSQHLLLVQFACAFGLSSIIFGFRIGVIVQRESNTSLVVSAKIDFRNHFLVLCGIVECGPFSMAKLNYSEVFGCV